MKNVTYNEPFISGCLPVRPLMPGVLVIEALAQAAGILCFVSAGMRPRESTLFYFGGLDRARFRKTVEPGDQLVLCARLERTVKTALRFSTTAFVGTAKVASANMMLIAAMVAD